ncbi:MAG: HAD family hydrolase [Thermoplasmata archaeon]|nr:HAD family hydrolase [Thermoplasmata archaeon]
MVKAVFLDRDGVINRLNIGSYVTSWDKFEFLKGAKQAIARLSNSEYLIFIITNQSAINRGLLTPEGLEVIHNNMLFEIEEASGKVEKIYHCPHRPDEKCKCRKPETGLFEQVSKDYDIDFPNSWFVGDFESDREVAEKVGLKFILAKDDDGLAKAVERILESS